MSANQPTAITLPPLDQDCPHCTTPEAQRQRAADYMKWSKEEQDAYGAFSAAYKLPFEAHSAWKKTSAYRELMDREPDPAGVGCVECDWTKRVLTDAGRQVLDFVRRWAK